MESIQFHAELNNFDACTEDFARYLDACDDLKKFREDFTFPGNESLYLAANRRGLPAKEARSLIDKVMRSWADTAVECHFLEPLPAATCEEYIVEQMMKLVGASCRSEVAAMNDLDTNLHLLLISFYRPHSAKHKILIVEGSSMENIARSHIEKHGFDYDESLQIAKCKDGKNCVTTGDIEEILKDSNGEISTVLLPAVHPVTGYFYEICKITAAAKEQGCSVGYDLSDAVGVVELELHQWNVDFACWSTGKYLGSGPVGTGCAFLHSNNFKRDSPKLTGWWGHKMATRFQMSNTWDGSLGINSYKISNQSPIKIAQLKAVLDIYDKTSISNVRRKSTLLIGYLEYLIRRKVSQPDGTRRKIEILTPSDPVSRGAHLSLKIQEKFKEVTNFLKAKGVICSVHLPNVLIISPGPLYSRFFDIYRFADILLQYPDIPENEK